MRRRNLKSSAEKSSKSPKSTKSPKGEKDYLELPKETCLVQGYGIEGTTELQTGNTIARIFSACTSTTDPPEIDYDCILDLYLETAFSAPFQYALNGATDTLQFTTEESLLGDGSLKGSIPSDSTVGADKIILSYLSTEYIQGVNDELWFRPVSDLEYIEYSFKVGACNGAKTSCPEQFYLNVYTRSPGEQDNIFYSCRYDFVPTAVGGEEGGEWTTIRYELTTVATTAVSGTGSTAGCPGGAVTLENAGNVNYLPSAEAGVIFALNMGDTSLTDNGLSGYFDSVIVKIKDEDARVFDLEPAV
eukprot:CAMPEP_0176494914 /NCGR_PEP_ID=MMETSP0200_2-20121128/10368_1 /TAXON_ID=947934 /ORGANISM="Chaetoceros sp., Strain GSL56" /LENGTH=302 /DNA_ID=CAMNT_0017892739 /DNA_START=107 /DNA_END=1014 /DNA_ORIENTATION=-